jgi:hypothetical protein
MSEFYSSEYPGKVAVRHWASRDERGFPDVFDAAAWLDRAVFSLEWGFLRRDAEGPGDDYVVFDDKGDVIPPAALRIVRWSLPRFLGRAHHSGHPGFRNGPVPHTRCWRPGGSMYRAVRTANERRANAAAIEDAREAGRKDPVRGRRRALPSTWDDVRVERHGRTWKAHRRTQYKPVAVDPDPGV